MSEVAAPLRAPVTEVVPDGSGAGETVVAAGSGWRWTPGELVSCPICIGTWVAAGLVYGLHLAPRPTRVFLAIMSATGVAQVLTETPEALTWTGRAARAQSTPPGDVERRALDVNRRHLAPDARLLHTKGRTTDLIPPPVAGRAGPCRVGQLAACVRRPRPD